MVAPVAPSEPYWYWVDQDRVDAETADDLASELRLAMRLRGPSLTLDLSHVRVVDANGLARLLQVLRESRELGGGIELVNVDPHINLLLHITGVSSLFGLPRPG